ALSDSERQYPHAMASRNMGSRIPDAVVDALHEAVITHAAPLARRYYRLKAAHLGLPRLQWSDRNAPMPFADTSTIPFERAKEMVIAAYESFSPTLAGLVRGQFDAMRIDAPATPGKMSGAFNYSIMIPGRTPVSFTQ